MTTIVGMKMTRATRRTRFGFETRLNEVVQMWRPRQCGKCCPVAGCDHKQTRNP